MSTKRCSLVCVLVTQTNKTTSSLRRITLIRKQEGKKQEQKEKRKKEKYLRHNKNVWQVRLCRHTHLCDAWVHFCGLAWRRPPKEAPTGAGGLGNRVSSAVPSERWGPGGMPTDLNFTADETLPVLLTGVPAHVPWLLRGFAAFLSVKPRRRSAHQRLPGPLLL